MECSICFHEFSKFKLLSCGHFFCEKCVSDLSLGKVVVVSQNDLKSNAKPSAPPVEEGEAKREEKSAIECPKCRQETPLDQRGANGLKSKFVGQLACIYCDSNKDATDFRWCETCKICVCSTCFVDKHVERLADGTTNLHKASKWEDLKGVEFCLEQLKLMENEKQKSKDAAKQYVATYVEGLEHFLEQQIDHKNRLVNENLTQTIATIQESFGIDPSSVKAAGEAKQSYEYVLAQICRLAALENKVAKAEEHQLSLQNVPYAEISKHMLTDTKEPFNPKWFKLDKVKENANKSFVIGGNLLKNPQDMCLLPDKTFVVSDLDLGVFLFRKRSVLQGPLPLKSSFQKYSQLCPVGSSSVLVTAHRNPQNQWSYFVLTINDRDIDQLTIEKRNHWPLPTNENLDVCSEGEEAWALGSKTLWKFQGAGVQWTGIGGVPADQYCRLAAVQSHAHSSSLYLVNHVWNSVDIVSIARHDGAIWAINRIEMPFDTLEHPFATPTPNFDGLIVGNKSDSKMLVCYLHTSPIAFQELCKFKYKYPAKLLLDNDAVFMIAKHKENKSRCLEMIPI